MNAMKAFLEVGQKYLVSRAPDEKRLSPRQGEIVMFEGGGYSRYDGFYLYAFSTLEGEQRIWTLPKDDANDLWMRFFEPVRE